MSISVYRRPLQGILTTGVFGAVAVTMWPTIPWLSGILGGLALYRFVVAIREWPREQ